MVTGPGTNKYELEVRKAFLQTEQSLPSEYAKITLVLATIVLVFSSTVVSVTNDARPSCTWLLALSWASLVISMSCAAISFHTRFLTMRGERLFMQGILTSPPKALPGVTAGLLVASLVTFILAAAMLAVFTYVNLPPASAANV